MESKDKQFYQVPLTRTIRVRAEGIICLSGTRNDYGDANEESWD